MLRAWLETNERSQAWLATRVGVRQSQVFRWLEGAEPKASQAAKIEEITGVPVRSWGEPAGPPPQPAEARR